MKYYTEKETNEIFALGTLAGSDDKEISNFATNAFEKIETIGIEVSINNEIIIDVRAKDEDLMLAEYIVAYDEYIASNIDNAEDFKICIKMNNLLTGEIVFESEYEIFNKGDSTSTREYCSRKSLREII